MTLQNLLAIHASDGAAIRKLDTARRNHADARVVSPDKGA